MMVGLVKQARIGIYQGKTRRDKTRFTLAWTGGFQDCLTLSLDFKETHQPDRDIPRKDEIFLVLNFKYLGAISQRDFTKIKS